jgi:hypothetical protein
MRFILITASIIGTLWASSVPAAAQYLFDRRIDPSNCHWWEVCDYGGRAYRPYFRRIVHHRRPQCSDVVEQRPGPNGTLVAVRTRRCDDVLRVRG